ncbi:MAG: hypothetical protein SOZ70_07395 [Bacilli bacterium]|nr:hypothetical protein [Bacilli bacterium]
MPKWIRNLINKNKALEILVENYNVRTIVFSLLSVLVAIGLAVFNIVIYYAITQSLWCGAMAFYHIFVVKHKLNNAFS